MTLSSSYLIPDLAKCPQLKAQVDAFKAANPLLEPRVDALLFSWRELPAGEKQELELAAMDFLQRGAHAELAWLDAGLPKPMGLNSLAQAYESHAVFGRMDQRIGKTLAEVELAGQGAKIARFYAKRLEENSLENQPEVVWGVGLRLVSVCILRGNLCSL